MNNSIKLKRRLTQTLTYLYLIGLSIVIIYPLLITIMSAFKTGNVVAFKLDGNVDFILLLSPPVSAASVGLLRGGRGGVGLTLGREIDTPLR